MKRYFIFLSLLLLTISCSGDNEIKEVELKKIRTISIPLEHNKNLLSNTLAFDSSDSTEYIIAVYPVDCMIYFYDLTTGQVRKSIKPPYPIVPREVFFLNKDSIFLSHSVNEMALINDRGDLINNWRFYRDTNLVFINYQPFYVSNNTIIFRGSASRLSLLENRYSKTPCIFKYSIEKNSSNVQLVQEIPYSPRFQTDTIWYETGTSFAIKDNKMYVSFSIEHNIFCYDGFKMHPIPAKSKYLNKFLPFERKRAFSIPYIDSMYTVISYYEELLYDKYNDLFFRKAMHQMPISYDGKTINTFDEKPFSFVIFDGNMKPINEVKMPRGLYNHMTFISKEGIILGRIPDCSDSLKFDVYTIKVKYKE